MLHTDTSTISATELLQDAKDAMAQCGWVQRQLGNPRKGFCIIGALHHVTPDKKTSTELLKHKKHAILCLKRAAGDHNENESVSLIRYNDKECSDISQVLNLFTRAITLSESTPCTST